MDLNTEISLYDDKLRMVMCNLGVSTERLKDMLIAVAWLGSSLAETFESIKTISEKVYSIREKRQFKIVGDLKIEIQPKPYKEANAFIRFDPIIKNQAFDRKLTKKKAVYIYRNYR